MTYPVMMTYPLMKTPDHFVFPRFRVYCTVSCDRNYSIYSQLLSSLQMLKIATTAG